MYDDFEKFLDDLSPGPVARKTPMILYRKGGDKTDWTTPGGTVYVPTTTIVQIGSVEWSSAVPAMVGNVSQALQAKYQGEPLIFLQVRVTTPAAWVTTRVSTSGDAVEISWRADTFITLVRFSYIVYGGPLRSG